MNSKVKKFSICGVDVHAVQPYYVTEIVLKWFKETRKFHYISSSNIYNILNALESDYYLKIINAADLSLPDGMPLIWYGRYLGYKLPKRCGIEEIMYEIFELSNKGYNFSHYFYGNTKDVLYDLKKEILKKYPMLNIVGMYAPPFRKLNQIEDDQIVQMINSANPDFLWVSLGCPKQEIWLFEHRNQLNAVMGGGAGAVFNFISKHTIKAPKWVQYAGLEWLLRLLTNPKRLCKRYLVKYPKFFIIFLKDSLSK